MRHSTRNTFILTFCFLVLYQLPKTFAQVKFPGGRIALSFDGNIHDMDDWGASAMSLAMIDAADLNSKLVHVDFNNHLGKSISQWESEMYESNLGAAQRFGFNKSVFFNDQNNLSSAINNLAAAINASSSSNPLWILAAGPMETVWRGINASRKDKRKYVNVVSHSKWNNEHSDTQALDHTWKDLEKDFKKDGVQFYKIKDQNTSNGNNDFSTSNSQWQWLKDADNSNFRWLYSRDAFSNKFDVSDAGMTYWLLSGGPNGGCQNCGWQEVRDLFDVDDDNKGDDDDDDDNDKGDKKSGDCPAVIVERNGKVVIEAERASSGSGWSRKTNIGGYTGSGYLEWTGSNQFNNPGAGTRRYQIYISKTGTYRFQWRNRIAKGSDNTEHNDAWLRFPNANDFYGQKGSSKVYPKGSGKSPNPKGASQNGWFKIYTNSTGWNWQTTTSDHDRHDIYVKFNSPGVYTLEVSGRSNGHAVDRMVLSHSSVSSTSVQSTNLGETTCQGSTPTANRPPTVSAGSDQTLTLPTNSLKLTAKATDADGNIASYQWTKVSGPNASLKGTGSPTMTVSNLVAGNYTFQATVTDDDQAKSSARVQVQVKKGKDNPKPAKPKPTATTHAVPGKIEAEAYATESGIQTETTSDAGGGKNVGYINAGDYLDYRVKVAQAGNYQLAMRVASATSGGSISLKRGSTTLGSVTVGNTGGWQSWRTVSTEVNLAKGEQTLRLQFNGSGDDYLLNVNYLHFSKSSGTNGGGSKALTLSPIHDAYLQKGERHNTTELRTEKGRRISYLMFDLSGVKKLITEAKLVLTAGSDAGWGSIQVLQGSHSRWTEDNLSEANKPSAQEMVGSQNGTFASGNRYTFTLTDIPAGGKVTLLVVHNSNEANVADVAFASSEANQAAARPKLVITTGGSNTRTVASNKADKINPKTEFPAGDIHVYPNPASEYVVVAGEGATSYTMVNQEGRVVQRGSLSTDSQIAVSQLKEGLYYLRLERVGKISSHKMLIRH